MKLISALIEEYRLIRFFTLTLDPEFIEGDSWKYIHLPWSKMRKRLKRKSSGFRFVAILERHKERGTPHIHGFTDLWMRQKEWSRHWNESRGGRVVWVEQVKSAKASEYVSKELEVAKYVGKDSLQVPHCRKGIRTLWRSSGLKARFELTTPSEWCILKYAIYNEDGGLTDYGAKKGVWIDGEKERKGEDVEGTCRPLFEQSVEAGVTYMET